MCLRRMGSVKHILNKDTERQQRLIMLMFKDDKWKSAKYISDTLSCNIKTLRQDIEYLTTTYEDILICDYSKNLGYKFFVKTGHSIQEIFLDWINHSLFFSIITDVFYQKNKDDKDYFYNTYFISETTLKRQVAIINYHLKELGISISLSQMNFKVTDEFVARIFFGNREMEKQSIYDWDDSQIQNQQYAFQIIEILEDFHHIKLTVLQKNMMAYFVLCSVIRSSGGFYLDEPNIIESPLMIHKNIQGILRSFKDPNNNMKYLTSREQINDTLRFLDKFFEKLKVTYTSKLATDISEELTQLIVDKMKTEIGVFDKTLLVKDIGYILFVKENYPYKMSYINHRGYFNSAAIQIKYPVFYQAVMDSFNQLSNDHIWLATYASELINSLFRYWNAQDYGYITSINQVKVFISTTLNENQVKLNQYIFEKSFKNKMVVIGYECQKASCNIDPTNKMLAEAELVICNHQFYQGLDNIIIVDDIIDDAKLYYINQRLNKIQTEKMTGL